MKSQEDVVNTVDFRYALALVATVTLCSCKENPTEPIPPEPPPLGTLVFVSIADSDAVRRDYDQMHIERMRTDGSGRAFVSDFAASIGRLDLSPDGNSVLFATSLSSDGLNVSRLLRLSLDTGVVEEVPSGYEAYDAAWSPDGSEIAYLSFHDGHGNVARMHADGSGIQMLTNDQRLRRAIDWSPDGDLLVFQDDHGGFYYSDLWTMPASGGTPTRLVRLVDQYGFPADCAEPSWSPSGSTVVFRTDLSGEDGIWRVEADGSGLRKIISGSGKAPAWSPDGEWIIFSKGVPYENPEGWSLELFVARDDGTELQQITATRNDRELGAVWVK